MRNEWRQTGTADREMGNGNLEPWNVKRDSSAEILGWGEFCESRDAERDFDAGAAQM